MSVNLNPIPVPNINDFKSLQQVDDYIAAVESELSRTNKFLQTVQTEIEKEKHHFSPSVNVAQLRDCLEKEEAHLAEIKAIEPTYTEAANKLKKHNWAVALVPEWNQLVRALEDNSLQRLRVSTSELVRLRNQVDDRLKFLVNNWALIVEFNQLESELRKLESSMRYAEERIREIYSERVALQNAAHTAEDMIAKDREVLSQRDHIEKLELKLQKKLEELEDERFTTNIQITEEQAEHEREVLTHKRDLIVNLAQTMPLLRLGTLLEIYRMRKITPQQARKRWQRALEFSELESENDFLSSLLSENEQHDLELIFQEFRQAYARCEERKWRIQTLIDLMMAHEQLTARHQSLIKAYAALEGIQRRFQAMSPND